MRFRRNFFCSAILAIALLGFHSSVHAQETRGSLKEQIDALNQQITSKRSRVKELEQLISSYKARIVAQEAKQTSLENEILLLGNRIRKKELDVQRAQEEADALALEIRALDDEIAAYGNRIDTQKTLVIDLIRRIRQADDVSPLEILIRQRSLSAFFDRVNELKRLEGNLTDALVRIKNAKQDREAKRKDRDAKRLALEEEKKRLTKEQLVLEAERNLKTSLASETKLKESEFQRALYEVREQQQGTADDISIIESRLKDKLDNIDQALARGDILLNWPVDPGRGITAKFHDPTYPFRHLFEHSGVDVRASVGTTVKAAAGGYVAWNKRGRLYGNYCMLIHPGNIATVYAHLSRFVARADTYVDRGEALGESGGMPGAPGAGLSTGPHLHFEVRQNGIPVNPENFLPSVSGEE